MEAPAGHSSTITFTQYTSAPIARILGRSDH
jgi:hypothetical protein